MDIKTVYFDLGNVLVFFSTDQLISQAADCTGIPAGQFRKLFLESELRALFEKGKITTEELYHQVQAQSPKSFSLSSFKHALSHIFTPNQELWPLVEQLKAQGMRLILLSNTCECHYEYIENHYPILQLFDHKILSYEVGCWKPEAAIFEKALAVAECPPENCFYTDDIPDFVTSAQKVGLPGAVFTTVEDLRNALFPLK